MIVEKFEVHPAARAVIDKLANELVLEIEEYEEPNKITEEFKTKKFISDQITDEDIRGIPIFGDTKDGKWISRYSYRSGLCIGLSENRYQRLREVVDQFLKIKWVRNTISEQFLEDEVLNWLLDGFGGISERSCVDEIIAKARFAIKDSTLIIPVAFIEVESSFQFGIVSVAPIEKELFDRQEELGVELNRENEEGVRAFFTQHRKRLQGSASIVVNLTGENRRIQERAIEIAEAAVSLLRIFSPYAYSPFMASPYALLGSEYYPTTTVISLRRDEDAFGISHAGRESSKRHWLISNSKWKTLTEIGLLKIAPLIDDAELSDFDRSVRVCLMTFSKGLTVANLGDRLVYALSALEGLLLRDPSEPIQQNIGERMAFLIEKSGAGRRQVVRNLKSVYKIRSQYIHHRISVSEEQDLEVFWSNLFKVILAVIDNLGHFGSRADFVNAVDDIKFGR